MGSSKLGRLCLTGSSRPGPGRASCAALPLAPAEMWSRRAVERQIDRGVGEHALNEQRWHRQTAGLDPLPSGVEGRGQQ
jgi:hypothetical protein